MRPTMTEQMDEELTGPSITKEEVEGAIQTSKEGKAPGPDIVLMELLGLLDNNSLKPIMEMFNRIYETGQYPNQ